MACRTSPKEATNTTPFRLTYGHEVTLPVEIYLQSTRIQSQREIPYDHYWNMMLDEMAKLDEKRLASLDVLIRKKERVVKPYNKKVNVNTFSVKDYVWKVILPMDRRDKALGK